MPTKTFFDLKEEKRERILNAARRVFAKNEYEKVSIQDIIREADIPRGSFYQYFTDKDDLYLYIFKVAIKKNISITYQDDMDYFWKFLYLDDFSRKSEMPWEQAGIEKLHTVMGDDEFSFAVHNAVPPARLQHAAFSDEGKVFFPLLQKHLASEDIVSDPESRDLLAFFFSIHTLLSTEYADLLGVPMQTTQEKIRPIYRLLYEQLRDKVPGNEEQLNQLITLHLLNGKGLDASVNLVPATPWHIETNREQTVLTAAILPGSLTGFLQLSPDAVPTVTDKGGNFFIFTLSEGKHTAITLCASGICYDLGENLTVIGTALGGEKLCLIENGIFLL